ncbi:sulfur carrier protein ThiS [Roseomonas elaeocarpi]|uniref:Sulfur carrier protein ThiS n=2 Tax=Roseomonas elaeocarpi TaxID=907779 RepID=A0ABV6JQL9_9PROT
MSEASEAFQISVNGEGRSVEAGLSLQQLLEQLGLDVRKVAVERNEEIVPRSTYGAVKLLQGDALEIVHFIGGG